MPIIVASLIRVLIQAAATTGIFILVEKLLSPLISAAKKAVKFAFNMTDEEAEDSIANEVIDAFAMIGIIGVTIKTKLPTIAAEKLGFSSKGFLKRKVSPKLPATARGATAKVAVTKVTGTIMTTAEATAVVEAAKISQFGFRAGYDFLFKHVGLFFIAAIAASQWLDFGNWNSGAYQKTMQKFYAWITFGKLVPDEDYRKTKTVSADIFTKVFETYKIGGALGIQDPYKELNVPFTRENFIDLLDQVGATLLLTTGSASTENVLKATQMMIVFDTTKDLDKILGNIAVAPADAKDKSTTIPTVKVFTGIVSQGVVGAGLVFESRPDDLIESVEEMKTAAANNLAPFLATLPGKIVYEVKIVSSVILKNGFKQTGTTQRIQTGTLKNGTPKYKTVTNKFATLVVYALTDKGSRAKLTTIVLGPTDSAKLTVGQNDLTALEKALPALVTTTNINDINGVANAPTIQAVAPPVQTSAQSVVPAPILTPSPALTPKAIFPYIADNGNIVIQPFSFTKQAPGGGYELKKADGGFLLISEADFQILRPFASTPIPALVPNTTPVVTSVAFSAIKLGASAVTLFEWYQAQGQALPSVSARSLIYARLRLGQASYYTGTAEQNTKLLAALKGGTNVQPFSAPLSFGARLTGKVF